MNDVLVALICGIIVGGLVVIIGKGIVKACGAW